MTSTTADAAPKFRYSNDQVTTDASAHAFTWEAPIPVSPFWDTFDYCIARNFLTNFTAAELSQLPIDPASTSPTATKTHLLLTLLRAKLAQEEASASPPQSLFTTDHQRWYSLWQGIFVYEDELGLPEAETTVRMLVAREKEVVGGGENVVPAHMLAAHLVKVGKFAEAEEVERPVCKWMDERKHLGRESPQAINARRIIAEAVWGLGETRREEAEGLVRELREIVEVMGGGRFAVYQEEERRLNEVLLKRIGWKE